MIVSSKKDINGYPPLRIDRDFFLNEVLETDIQVSLVGM